MRLIRRCTHKKYPNELLPQPKRLTLGKDGNVTLDYKPNIGPGTSPERWHNVTPTIEFYGTTPTRAIVVFYGKHKDLFERLREGHAVVWDGSNHVGELTEDARNAWVDLMYLAEQL